MQKTSCGRTATFDFKLSFFAICGCSAPCGRLIFHFVAQVRRGDFTMELFYDIERVSIQWNFSKISGNVFKLEKVKWKKQALVCIDDWGFAQTKKDIVQFSNCSGSIAYKCFMNILPSLNLYRILVMEDPPWGGDVRYFNYSLAYQTNSIFFNKETFITLAFLSLWESAFLPHRQFEFDSEKVRAEVIFEWYIPTFPFLLIFYALFD